MIQSRRMSLVESVTNIAVGLLVSMAANAIVLPWFGFHITAAQNVALSVIFTAISLARSYTLRRAFEWLRLKGVN